MVIEYMAWAVEQTGNKRSKKLNPLYVSIVLGVVSGLLASAMGLLFRSFWLNTIKPAYENSIYKDAKIEGKWHGYFVSEYNESIEQSRER